VIDLSTISSPYIGSNFGNSNEQRLLAVCGDQGECPDQVFSTILQPGEQITIGLTSSMFQADYALLHGGEFPGKFGDCRTSWSFQSTLSGSALDIFEELSYTNDGTWDNSVEHADRGVPVYYVVGGAQVSDGMGEKLPCPAMGTFVLAWVIDRPGIFPHTSHV
jgi:hypothetical protein